MDHHGAKQTLSNLTFANSARVVVEDIDRCGRTIGRVFVGGVDVNAALVEQGPNVRHCCL